MKKLIQKLIGKNPEKKAEQYELAEKLRKQTETLFKPYDEEKEQKETQRTSEMRDKIKNMNMEAVNDVLKGAEWSINDHDFKLMMGVREEMLKMSPQEMLERFKKMTESGRRLWDKAMVRIAAEERKQELFMKEWSSWGSETVANEEIPIANVQPPEEEMRQSA